MKTVKTLVNTNKERLRIGNHCLERTTLSRLFFYHWTCIIEVNDLTKVLKINDGGFKTPSTTRAINAYLREFDSGEYTIIDERRCK